MRKLILMAAFAGMAASATPSQAREIAWCARTPNNYYGDCMYYTYAQCFAAISGLPGDCIRNPFASYGSAPAPRHRRHHRSY